MIDPAIPMELVEEIRKGNTVFFVGPGLAIGIGLPSASQLARELAERLGKTPEEEDLASLAEYYERKFGRHRLITYLRERFDAVGIKPTPTYRLLAELPVRYIITTNFDTLLEDSFRQAGQKFNRVISDADLPFISEDRVQIIKLHGSIDQPSTVVVTLEDRLRLYDPGLPALRDILGYLFVTKSFIFLGYSPNSDDFRLLLRFESFARRSSLGKHSYLVAPTVSSHEVAWFDRHGIDTILADPGEFLKALGRQLAILRPEPRVEREAPPFAPQAISSYQSFNLRASGQPGSYSVMLYESPIGEAKTDFELPVTRLQLEDMLSRIRRYESDEDFLRQIGSYLFSALFTEPLKSALDKSFALLSPDEGLRINLRIDSPELASLPWELMYDPERTEFLALSLRTPVARYPAVPMRLRELEVTLPLRVLVVAPTPASLPPVDVEREEMALTRALDPLIRRGSVEVHFLHRPTIASLQRELRKEQFHILHYVGHGHANVQTLSSLLRVKEKAQVFLSYAREDEEEVENLYRKLAMAGFKPWMDKKDILPGEKWRSSIQKAIRRSDFLLTCLSPNSVSKRGFLQKEISDALDMWQEMLDSDIYLIPVRLEDCEVPGSLRDFQWVNLFEEDGWTQLVKAIQIGMERRAEVIKPQDQDSYFAFEGEYIGSVDLVSADRLSYILSDSSIRLVVLNTSATARALGDESLVSIGAALVRSGIPASVDMQFPITEENAIAFSRGFYSAIADGLPVDASLQEARRSLALASGLGSPDWASPVLFSGVRDEVIFTIRKQSELSALAVSLFREAGFGARILSTDVEGAITDLLLDPQRLHYSKYGSVLARCVETSEIEIDDIVKLRNDALSHFQDLDPARGLQNRLAFLVSSKRPNRAVLLPLYTYKEQDDFTIVPVEADFMRSALSKEDVGTELDYVIDQYTGHMDLYDIHLPITDPMWFFGRDNIINEIIEYVRRSQHVGIFGIRKIGKTSLIRQITYKLGDDLLCYIDLQGLPRDCRYLYERIIRELSDDLRRHTDKRPKLALLDWDFSSEQDIVYAFRQDTTAIRDTMLQINPDHKVVIVIDEIDRMLPAKVAEKLGLGAAVNKLLHLTQTPVEVASALGFAGFEEFLSILRAISQEDNRLVLIVTSADAEINRVGRWRPGTGRDNPMRESFVEVWLPPLRKADCWQMIESIGHFMGVSYTRTALEAIYDLTSGHPYIARQLCSSIVNNRPRVVDLLDVREGVERFLSKTNFFRVMWEDLAISWGDEADLIRSLLISMALSRPISQAADISLLSTENLNAMLGYLREQHLVRGTGDDCRLSMGLFAEWIRWTKATAAE